MRISVIVINVYINMMFISNYINIINIIIIKRQTKIKIINLKLTLTLLN